MIRLLLVTIICLSLATACKEKKVDQPFPDEKMVSILTDMYIIEATMTGKTPNEVDSLKLQYRKVLMEDYQLDSGDINNMKEYLESHPEKSKEFHDKARNRIDQLQKSVN